MNWRVACATLKFKTISDLVSQEKRKQAKKRKKISGKILCFSFIPIKRIKQASISTEETELDRLSPVEWHSLTSSFATLYAKHQRVERQFRP